MTHVRQWQLLFSTLAFAVFAEPTSKAGHVSATPAMRQEQAFDVKKLHGTWNVEFAKGCQGETGEIKDLRGDLKYILLISAHDTMRLEIEGIKFFEWAIKYDLKKKPIQIEITAKCPSDEKTKFPKSGKGLLEVDGNNLMIHLGYQIQPTDFEQKKGLTSVLFKCKKIKE